MTEIRGANPNITIFQVPQPVEILLILHVKGANYHQAGFNPNLSHYDLPNSTSMLSDHHCDHTAIHNAPTSNLEQFC